MTETPNSKDGSFRCFAAWLAALFLVVLGAKLWVVQLYGSPLPLWDQWYEAGSFFVPWVEGHLTPAVFFAPDNEHRIVFTRLLDLGLIWLNGRWEPLLQMAVNAFIHAGFACALAFCLWNFLGRKNGWVLWVLVGACFALPFAAENTIWAINSQQYFMSCFALATLAGLGFGKPVRWLWWFGLGAAILGLFTMASGLLAPLAAGGLVILRAGKQRRLEKNGLITLATCLSVFGLGAALMAAMPEDQMLRAHTAAQFIFTLAHNLAWPFINAPIMMWFVLLPLAWLLVLYFRPNFPFSRAAEFLFALAIWSRLQSTALAYGRANYGDGIPASRYMDLLDIFVIASVFASVLLAQSWRRGAFSAKFTLLPPLVFFAVILFGLCHLSQITVENLLLPTRMMNLVAEERVATFMTTGNERDLLEEPTVRPDASVALGVLRNVKLQTILPAVCLPPADAHVTGRLTAVSQCLLQNSTGILYCGLGLFAGLVCCALIRSPLGLAWENLPAGIALLTILAALGFVWSNAPTKRETIERDLDYQLAAHFKSVNNTGRARIFERRAEMLQPRENSNGSGRP